MHFIQKHILRLLSQYPSRRYSELQLHRVESNKFTYHLKKLMSGGYIKKAGVQYKLTTKGIHYCTRVNFDEHFVRIQPKVATLIVCKNEHAEFLMYQRATQPFLGMIGFPYGKVHLGESVKEAAEREIVEKTGITATLEQKGITYLLVTDERGEVIEHMLCHVFIGINPKGTVENNPELDHVLWMNKSKITKSNSMPGVADVLRIATSAKRDLQFEELAFIHTKRETPHL